MPDFTRLPHLLAAFGLCLPLLASAQATAPMSDAERARRDAEKVFSFIKFQTVPAKPAADAPRKPARPAAVAAPPATAPLAAAAPVTPDRAITAARPPEAAATVQPAPAARPVASLTAVDTPPTPEPTALAVPTSLAPSLALPQAAAALPAPAAAMEPEPEADDADDGALQLQNFVAPVLTPAVQATLGPGTRNIKVRFTVEANGRVSQAEPTANVPRRLAKPAIDAILQWQFAPLPQPRTVDVEIAFRRD